MQVIKRSEWLAALDECNRHTAKRPHPKARTVKEAAKELGKSVPQTYRDLERMVAKGIAKKLTGTVVTDQGHEVTAIYYLLTKDAK